jgi:hypothetical protein
MHYTSAVRDGTDSAARAISKNKMVSMFMAVSYGVGVKMFWLSSIPAKRLLRVYYSFSKTHKVYLVLIACAAGSISA